MDYRVSDSEFKFLELLWSMEPVESPKLVEACSDSFGWKKSTTYTVIKRLSQKGIVVNENAVVSTRVSKAETVRYEADELLNSKFSGNIPAFMAAFLSNKKITEAEAKKLYKLIEDSVK